MTDFGSFRLRSGLWRVPTSTLRSGSQVAVSGVCRWPLGPALSPCQSSFGSREWHGGCCGKKMTTSNGRLPLRFPGTNRMDRSRPRCFSSDIPSDVFRHDVNFPFLRSTTAAGRPARFPARAHRIRTRALTEAARCGRIAQGPRLRGRTPSSLESALRRGRGSGADSGSRGSSSPGRR